MCPLVCIWLEGSDMNKLCFILNSGSAQVARKTGILWFPSAVTCFFIWDIGIFYRLLLECCSDIGCLLLTIPHYSFVSNRTVWTVCELATNSLYNKQYFRVGQLGGHCIVNFLLMMHCLFTIKAQKKYSNVHKKILPKFAAGVWCLDLVLAETTQMQIGGFESVVPRACFCYVGYKDVGEQFWCTECGGRSTCDVVKEWCYKKV